MAQFLSLRLKNVGLFKKAALDFSKPGITIVRGRNLNARSKNQTNAAGKSYLLSTLASVLQQGPPLSISRREKTALLTDGSCTTVELKRGEDTFRIEQVLKGKSVKYRIFKNGKDQKVRTTPLAEKYLTELQPWNKTEFYSTIYLDGRRPFAFQFGTDVQRLEFITSLFRLEEYDHVRKLLNSLRSDKKEDATKLSVIVSELVRTRKELKELDWSKAKALTLKQCKQLASKLRAQHEKLTERINEVGRANSLLEQRSKVEELIAQLAHVKEDEAALQEKLNASLEWKHYEERLVEHQQEVQRLNKALSSIKKELHDVDLTLNHDKEQAKVQNELGSVRSKIEHLTEAQEEFDAKLKQLRKRYSALKDAKPTGDKELLLAQQREQEQIVKLGALVHKGHDSCPTCGSNLNAKTATARAKRAKKELQRLAEALQMLERYDQLQIVLAEGTELRKRMDSEELDKLNALRDQYAKLKKKLTRVTEVCVRVRKLKEIQQRLKEEEAPTKPTMKKPASTHKQLTTLLGEARSLRKYRVELKRLSQEIDELNVHKPQKLKPLLDEQKQVNDKMFAEVQRLSELQQQRRLWKAAMSRKQTLEADKERLDKAVGDLPVIEALIHVYSNKGLKVLIAQQLAARIEQSLNDNAALIFVEPVKFRLKVEPNKFSVEFKRYTSEWADIRRLSGAESRSFNLLFLASLLPMLPSERRSNLLVLDELDANMSEDTRKLFATDFLPYLQTLVPSVYVITPDHRTPYPGKQLLVTKKGNASTLTFSNGHSH